MTAPRIRALALALLSLAAAAGARADGSGLSRLFPLAAPIRAERPGLVRLALPVEVIRQCRPDLSDLRVFDARGREVAYLLDDLRVDERVRLSERFEPEVLSLLREEIEPELGPSRQLERYVIQAPPAASAAGIEAPWQLVFEVSAPRFVREVAIRTDLRAREAEEPRTEAIFRLDAHTRRMRLPLPTDLGRAIELEIRGSEGFFLEPRLWLERSGPLPGAGAHRVVLEELGRSRVGDETHISLSRPGGVVPDLLELATSTGALKREVVVFDLAQGRPDRRIGGGRIERAQPGALDPIALLPARGDRLRVEIRDGDSPPLAELRISALLRRPVLIFELPAGDGPEATGTLRFGGGRALRPRYDLAAFRAPRGARLDPAQVAWLTADAPALAQLGEALPNPDFDERPALHFAMRPAAALDPRIFETRREIQVEPSPEGLSRIELQPEDQAGAGPELADLRVVDADSRQWPYLLARDARATPVDLRIETQGAERGVSRYELHPPTSSLRADRITLHTRAPFFDRPYRLVLRDAEGREILSRSGRLIVRALDPSPPFLHFGTRRFHSALLEIDDGDDAELVFDAAVARARLTDLFLAAPAGRYALLLGDPDLPAPRYELERARELVLAARSVRASLGPIAPNPGFSLRARLEDQGFAGGLARGTAVWVALLAAVAVLTALTLRVLRHAPEPADPEHGPGA